MRTSEIRRSLVKAAVAVTVATTVAGAAAAAPTSLFAQQPVDTGRQTTMQTTDRDDDGMDLGWLGLLGLAGLLGLRRRDHDTHAHTDSTTRRTTP
jgi:MYXO-CTERM domain-containing protein